jgi:hypothetical protein
VAMQLHLGQTAQVLIGCDGHDGSGPPFAAVP